MPIVLSTVGVGYGFNGPTLASILAEPEGIEPIDRTSMNAFEDQAFREPGRGDRAQAADHRRTAHRDLPFVRDGAGSAGRNTELFRDWASPVAGVACDVIYWYVTEVSKLTDRGGVANPEKQASAAVLQGAK